MVNQGKIAAKQRMSVSELASAGAGIKRQGIYKAIKQAGLEPDADRKYDVDAVMAVLAKRAANDNRNIQPGSPKERKIEKEIELLQARIDEIKRRVIPMEEHIAVLQGHAAMVATELRMHAAEVAAEGHDIPIVKRWREHVETAIERLGAAVAACIAENATE